MPGRKCHFRATFWWPDDAELDGQGGVGHRDHDGLPSVGAAQSDLLPADHDHAGSGGVHCTRMGGRGGGGRGGRHAAGPPERGERLGPGARQHPGGVVIEHQGGGLNADADQLAGGVRGEQAVWAEADQAAAGHRPLDLDRLALFAGRQRGGPSGDRALRDAARNKPIELIDGANLLYLLAEYANINAKIVPPDNWTDPIADMPDATF